MPPSLQRPRPHIQFTDLFLIQLSNFRWSWRGMVVTGMLAPILATAALGAFAGRDQESLTYVLCGSIVLSLMFQNQNNVAANFGFMKAMGTLDFFATLPVHRSLVILATVLAFFVLSIPSLIATAVLGTLILGVPLSISPLALLVVPLCVLPMAGIGALIGITVRSPAEAGSVSMLVTLLLLFMGPVILPPGRLPDWMIAASHFSPTSYAASAIRQVVIGPVTGRVWLDMAALALVTAVTLWGVGHKLPWHQK